MLPVFESQHILTTKINYSFCWT